MLTPTKLDRTTASKLLEGTRVSEPTAMRNGHMNEHKLVQVIAQHSLDLLAEVNTKHDQRVTELLNHNNELLERTRVAERKVKS